MKPIARGRIPDRPPRAADEIPGYLDAFTNYERRRPAGPWKHALGPGPARALIQRAGLAPRGVPVVQVAGSKGKGSTVLWLEGLLRGRGARPGAFLSPHLERLHERIRLDGEEVGDEHLLAALTELHPVLQGLPDGEPVPTFFDLWLAVALATFARAEVRPLLLEVGLGGPLDSTSAVPHDVGVLTVLDLEHTAELGSTVEAIAGEKARIARPGRAFVIAEPTTPAGARAAAVATRAGAHVVGVEDRVAGRVGAPQDLNLSTAITALECLEPDRPVTPAEIDTVISRVRLPGRLETLPGPPPLLLDTAHTRSSLAHFRRRFRAWREERTGVILVGFLEDKAWRESIEVFADELPELEWIVTRPHAIRGLDPSLLVSHLELRGARAQRIDAPEDALVALRSRASAGHAIAVTGSFYLAGRARAEWAKLRA